MGINTAWFLGGGIGGAAARGRFFDWQKPATMVNLEKTFCFQTSLAIMRSRTFLRRSLLGTSLLGLTLAGASKPAHADWREDVGYAELATELGAALPTGAGVVVSMGEAPNAAGAYMPSTGGSNFSGKTFIDATGTSTGSIGHATNTASTFLGNTTSIAPGVTTMHVFDANSWLNNSLGAATGTAPIDHSGFGVQNHSWILNAPASENAAIINLSQRVDYLVNRDNVLVIGGTTNNSGSGLADMLATSYNAIIVGRSDGVHGRGTTSLYGAGRQRPDIVAPLGTTSTATPAVASAAAMLLEFADGTNAVNTEVMRAVLMAGATKNEFASWDRTATRPIDDIFGAGELNVANSYRILAGGEVDGVIGVPTVSAGLFGYDYANPTDMSLPLFYDFVVPTGFVMNELSIFLQWNIDVQDIDGDPLNGSFSPTVDLTPGGDLANFDLAFFGPGGSLIDQSISAVDNFEHIYLTGLLPGSYQLRVSGDRGDAFGLAWRSRVTAIPEPGTWLALTGMTAWMVRRRAGRRTRTTS